MSKREVSQPRGRQGQGTLGTNGTNQAVGIKLLHDPRRDLAEDSAAWNALLELAYPSAANPHGLYGLLRGLRCLGARLTRGQSTYRLLPGDINPDEYAAYRDSWIAAHRERLPILLREMMTLLGAA